MAYNTLYQFWIHTQYIDKMGWLEYIINTPSHHRVHHGRNPEYIDKNHAGSLIIWDKLFGTFAPERAPVVYGITAPVNSWNPVYAQVAHLNTITQDLKAAQGWREVVRVLFGRPGWHPRGSLNATNPPHISDHRNSSDQTLSSGLAQPSSGIWINLYVLMHYLFLLGASTYFLFRYEQSSLYERLGLAIWIFATAATLGMILEKHRSAITWEGIRLILTVSILFYWIFRQ